MDLGLNARTSSIFPKGNQASYRILCQKQPNLIDPALDRFDPRICGVVTRVHFWPSAVQAFPLDQKRREVFDCAMVFPTMRNFEDVCAAIQNRTMKSMTTISQSIGCASSKTRLSIPFANSIKEVNLPYPLRLLILYH